MSTVAAPARIGRAEFVAEVRSALESGRGYAAGKIGNTERAVLRYPFVREQLRDPVQLRAFELALANHALRHSGVFPPEPSFLRRFADVYVGAITSADAVGLFPEQFAHDAALLARHGFSGGVMPFQDQEPDRSVPADDDGCYLPSLRGRHVLLVSPFAELLRARATRETFEAVWAKAGKRWFEPASVQALELPYGYSPATWRQYGSALDLLAEVSSRMRALSFDAALIGAGLLGTPLAVSARETGRVAISLGGHLQIVFGVNGTRWRDRINWRRKYFNDAWVELPERYRPDPRDTDENYW